MKASCLPSACGAVAALAIALAITRGADTAGQPTSQPDGPTDSGRNLQKIGVLECKGAFVCRQDKLLFITGAGKGHCLDLAGDPSSPAVLSDSLPHAWDIAVKGDYAFVVGNTRLVDVYDISDRRAWRKVAECKVEAVAENVIVRDDFAYVAADAAGLQIINVRDPLHPTLAAASKVAKQDIDAVGLAGDVAYLYDHVLGTLRLVDVADPTQPKHLSLFENGKPFIQGEMDVCGGYAYCVAGQQGVVIVDVRDRTAPKLAAVFDTPGFASDVIVSDGFAFVADGPGGVRVADVRDPTRPVEVAHFTSKDLNAQQLAVLGNLAYVANKPPLSAMILRFQPPARAESQKDEPAH